MIDDSVKHAKFDIFHAKLLNEFLNGNFIVFEGIFEFLRVIEGMSLIYSLIQNDKFIAISAASCVNDSWKQKFSKFFKRAQKQLSTTIL